MGEHAGHRERMRQKLERGLLYDYEYLEVILYTVIPRRNTSDIAHRLLARFGTLEKVLTATYDELCQVHGVGIAVANFLLTFGMATENYPKRKSGLYQGKFTIESFISHNRDFYQDEPVEILDVYFLDKDANVFDRHRFTYNDCEKILLDPYWFTEALVEGKPAGVLLVHNHPNGKPEPSKADEDFTRKYQLACSYHNVRLCDHLIFGEDGVYSYYLSGRLKEISKDFSVVNVVGKN